MKNGPDARYREPHGTTADGFSTSRSESPFDVGSPEQYARGKAAAFPDEGGPAILEFELLDDLVGSLIGEIGEIVPDKAFDAGTEIRFEPGGGLEPLIAVWPHLTKKVTAL